jgi:hypothetical protein
MSLKNIKHIRFILLLFSFFLNSCKDIEEVSEKQKSCNVLNQKLNEIGVKYNNITSTADSVIKNQSCEAYLTALIEYTKVSNQNKCLSKSDSINNARMLSTVKCKCTEAFISMNTADVTFKNSSTLSKDSVLRNNNCEALSKQLKSFINISSWYKCFLSKSDSVQFAQKLNGLGCKCTDAFNAMKITENAYRKLQSPADSAKNCKIYSQALTSYIKIGSGYKCLSTTDSTSYVRILNSLKCK